MHGVEGLIVRVETGASPGTPGISIIGLPDRSLNESKDRVRSALINSGFMLPAGRLLVSLAPADVRKEGPAFDLPIALALLAMDGQLSPKLLADYVMLGELALDGSLRTIAGTLPMLIAAKRAGIGRAIVPITNHAEAALIPDVETYAVPTLADAFAVVLGNGEKFRVGVPARAISTANRRRRLRRCARTDHREARARDRRCRRTQRDPRRTARLR